eukprot:403349970
MSVNSTAKNSFVATQLKVSQRKDKFFVEENSLIQELQIRDKHIFAFLDIMQDLVPKLYQLQQSIYYSQVHALSLKFFKFYHENKKEFVEFEEIGDLFGVFNDVQTGGFGGGATSQIEKQNMRSNNSSDHKILTEQQFKKLKATLKDMKNSQSLQEAAKAFNELESFCIKLNKDRQILDKSEQETLDLINELLKIKNDSSTRYIISNIESLEERVISKLRESDELSYEKVQPKLKAYQEKCKQILKIIEKVVFQHESSQDSVTQLSREELCQFLNQGLDNMDMIASKMKKIVGATEIDLDSQKLQPASKDPKEQLPVQQFQKQDGLFMIIKDIEQKVALGSLDEQLLNYLQKIQTLRDSQIRKSTIKIDQLDLVYNFLKQLYEIEKAFSIDVSKLQIKEGVKKQFKEGELECTVVNIAGYVLKTSLNHEYQSTLIGKIIQNLLSIIEKSKSSIKDFEKETNVVIQDIKQFITSYITEQNKVQQILKDTSSDNNSKLQAKQNYLQIQKEFVKNFIRQIQTIISLASGLRIDQSQLLKRVNKEIIHEVLLAVLKLNIVSGKNNLQLCQYINDDYKFCFGNKYYRDQMKEIYERIYVNHLQRIENNSQEQRMRAQSCKENSITSQQLNQSDSSKVNEQNRINSCNSSVFVNENSANLVEQDIQEECFKRDNFDTQRSNSVRLNQIGSQCQLARKKHCQYMQTQSVVQMNNIDDTEVASGNALIISTIKSKLFDEMLARKEILKSNPNAIQEVMRLKERINSNGKQSNLKASFSKQKQPIDSSLLFVIEQFGYLDEEEVFKESYLAALQLRILIQGRIYITNKRLVFHSCFNEKTIFFGKDTKLAFFFTDIKQLEKQYNAKVFDNSIAIQTHDNGEFFFTSFVHRDACFDLINDMIELAIQDCKKRKMINNVLQRSQASSSQSPQKSQDIDDIQNQENSKILNPNINQQDLQQVSQNQESNNNSNNINQAIQQQQSLSMNTKIKNNFEINDEFLRLEQQRFQESKKLIPGYDDYKIVTFEDTVNASIQTIVTNYFDFTHKSQNLRNESVLTWLEKNILTNIDMVFNPTDQINTPQYFKLNGGYEVKDNLEFKEWPLVQKYDYKFIHVTENPKFMQPKQNKANEYCENYFISPRMVIRKVLLQNEGFTFADCFNIEWKVVFEDVTHTQPNKSIPTVKVRSEFKINMIKPVRFLQGTLLKETEKSLRDAYGVVYYKNMRSKLEEQQRFADLKKKEQDSVISGPPQSQRNNIEANQSFGSDELVKKDNQMKNGSSQFTTVEANNNLQITTVNVNQVSQIKNSQPLETFRVEEENIEIDNNVLRLQIQDLKQSIDRMSLMIYGVVALNIFTIIMIVVFHFPLPSLSMNGGSHVQQSLTH